VVFFAIGFETTTPPTALWPPSRRRRSAEELQRAVLPRADAVGDHAHPRIARGAPVGTVPLDGFIGPAHVSTVIGSRPYEFFAEEYRKPVVIAGFEPLDVMQAILMLVRQVNEGRAEVENEFTRAVTPRRQPARRRRCGRGVRAARAFEWRGLGECPTARCASARPSPPSTPSAASASPTAGADTRPASAAPSCAASSARRLQALRHRVHAGEPDGLVHGVVRRRLRGALHLRPLQGHSGGERGGMNERGQEPPP
jgi:hypothetical protein